MSEFKSQGASWADYLGDTLRGNVPINQLIPQHPYILDTLGLEKEFEKNTQHIMLLTLDEVQGVIDDICNSSLMDVGSTYAGNISDAAGGAKKISKLTSYFEADKLVYRLKGLGIKAIKYIYKGEAYVKITGYASLRRILQGTRYKINHPEVLELGIGKAGVNAGIIEGAKICIWFSICWRLVEVIFKSEHDVAAFIGNITMDVAKIIVTIFLTKILIAAGAGAAAFFSITAPIALGIFAVVAVGFVITAALDYLDDKYHLSDRLIAAIKEGMDTHQKVIMWNINHTGPFTFGLMNTQ